MTTTQTETVDTEQTPARLIELRKKIAAMEAEKNSATDEESKLAAESLKLQQAIRDRAAKRQQLADNIAAAERQAIDEQRKILPPAVTKTSATKIAHALILAFADSTRAEDAASERIAANKKPAEQTASELWDAIDDARFALLTPEIDEDAHPIVLALEAIIQAADEWAAMRRPEFGDARNADGEPLADIRAEIYPSHSTFVKRFVLELKDTLSGHTPAVIEGIGELLGQGVSVNQICRMHGLQLPDGSPDFGTLGMLIDRALGKTSFYREANPWTHIKRMGALSMTDAWSMRSNELESRRQASHSMTGAQSRAGRLADALPADNNDSGDGPLHHTDVRHKIYHESKLAAEEATRAANAPKLTDVSELVY